MTDKERIKEMYNKLGLKKSDIDFSSIAAVNVAYFRAHVDAGFSAGQALVITCRFIDTRMTQKYVAKKDKKD